MSFFLRYSFTLNAILSVLLLLHHLSICVTAIYYINCDGDTVCASATRTCNAGEACQISCTGNNACNLATFNCPSGDYDCTFTCSGNPSEVPGCWGATIDASNTMQGNLMVTITSPDEGAGEYSHILCPRFGDCLVTCKGKKSCKNVNIEAQTTTNLLEIKGRLNTDNVLGEATVRCPSDGIPGRTNNCIIDIESSINYKKAIKSMKIYAVEGFTDVNIHCPDSLCTDEGDPRIYCGTGYENNCYFDWDGSGDNWRCNSGSICDTFTLPPLAVTTQAPSDGPSAGPSANPSANPSSQPTGTPTTDNPTTNTPTTGAPSSNVPTATPTQTPTNEPTETPTKTPTEVPTNEPTKTPTNDPTATPTKNPTNGPTRRPSDSPSKSPITAKPISAAPSERPSASPVIAPTVSPVPLGQAVDSQDEPSTSTSFSSGGDSSPLLSGSSTLTITNVNIIIAVCIVTVCACFVLNGAILYYFKCRHIKKQEKIQFNSTTDSTMAAMNNVAMKHVNINSLQSINSSVAADDGIIINNNNNNKANALIPEMGVYPNFERVCSASSASQVPGMPRDDNANNNNNNNRSSVHSMNDSHSHYNNIQHNNNRDPGPGSYNPGPVMNDGLRLPSSLSTSLMAPTTTLNAPRNMNHLQKSMHHSNNNNDNNHDNDGNSNNNLAIVAVVVDHDHHDDDYDDDDAEEMYDNPPSLPSPLPSQFNFNAMQMANLSSGTVAAGTPMADLRTTQSYADSQSQSQSQSPSQTQTQSQTQSNSHSQSRMKTNDSDSESESDTDTDTDTDSDESCSLPTNIGNTPQHPTTTIG